LICALVHSNGDHVTLDLDKSPLPVFSLTNWLPGTQCDPFTNVLCEMLTPLERPFHTGGRDLKDIRLRNEILSVQNVRDGVIYFNTVTDSHSYSIQTLDIEPQDGSAPTAGQLAEKQQKAALFENRAEKQLSAICNACSEWCFQIKLPTDP
jgi:hypothetical protein